MTLVKNAGIDAFALNMANNDSTNDIALPLAFSAAAQTNFKLFFSFDYAGQGPWDLDEVITKIQTYGPKPTYFTRGSQPFVSTFRRSQASHGLVNDQTQNKVFLHTGLVILGRQAGRWPCRWYRGWPL